jgi:hypothetical protein
VPYGEATSLLSITQTQRSSHESNKPCSGVMQKKQAFIGILMLSLALVPRTAMAELDDGSLTVAKPVFNV